MGKLTATQIKALREPGSYGDGEGLYLAVSSTGSASWIVRVQKDGRRREFGLGSRAKVSLAQARDRASRIRAQVEGGLDPVAERRRAAGVPTFREASIAFYTEHEKGWRSGPHRSQWLSSLEAYAFPALGTTRVDGIEAPAVRDVLAAIWLEKPETARRVKQRVAAVLDWAHAKGYRVSEAPLRALSKGLPRHRAAKGHHAALHYSELPAFVGRLRERETFGRLALEALILTAARPGEIRGATWDELDLEAGLWTIPGSKMKGGREHRVPLSPSARRVFIRARELRNPRSNYVFQGARADRPMSDATLGKVARDMGFQVTAHGFRATFKSWAAEQTHFVGEIVEMALAHTQGKLEAAYQRGDLLERRRPLLEAWADYAAGGSTNVVRLVA